ncbi:hypothetical protein [Actinoplanes sp. NPDC026619]|uniref:hypothetical protein n=1 Tax=Actinoplanes sp. NPDC026619 TaxID=3155798 RepID=UPI0033E86A4C
MNRPGVALVQYLTEMAEEVHPVDLGERVRAGSRRVRRRRRVALVATVAAAVALASGVGWAGRPSPNGLSDRPAAPAPATIPAGLYYLDTTVDSARVLLLDGAGQAREVKKVIAPECGVTLSPDRRQVAWVEVDVRIGTSGPLMVAHAGQKDARKVLDDVRCTGGDNPVWLPDSARLLIARSSAAQRRLVEASSGAVSDTPFAAVRDYVCWSPNGQYVAYRENSQVVVARAGDGTVVHRIVFGDESVSVRGVSDDGGRAVTSAGPSVIRYGAPQLDYGSHQVDTVTGEDVPLPAEIAPAEEADAQVQPAPGNHVLVRIPGSPAAALYLLDAAGRILDRRAEPETLKQAALIGQ